MALRSPADDGVNFRDPYQLERLADELATREQGREDDEHDLPAFIPLAHDNPHLTATTFNVEEFLLSRSYTSLSDLRTELRDYLSTLKEELVKLINDDYEAFISLSTDLQGEGARLNRLQAPLGAIKSQILESRKELCVIQDAIQQKLNKRAVLREEMALLSLLLRISDSVARLEALLHIDTPGISPNEVRETRLPAQFGTADDGAEDRSRNNRAKHLNRVASEYTQLLYHAAKARAEKCRFVDEIQWRIDRIQSTLSSDLDNLFGATLLALADGKKEASASEVEKAKWMADLTECLRSYDMLGLWRDAEDVLRRDVVRAFVKKTIHPSALNTPHSPILPHTPFPNTFTVLSSSSQLPPRTPYTPFTAFPLTHDLNHSSGVNSGSPYAHILNDDDHPLAKLYNQVLRFIERDICRIMNLADRIPVHSSLVSTEKTSGIPGSQHGTQGFSPSEEGFQIMANVVWEEIGRAIMDELGAIIFGAGRPNEFRKNYELTQAFIRSLEYLSPSQRAAEAMRAHPLFISFQARWQLPVYFQLRWKEIVGKLEEALSVRRIEPSVVTGRTAFATSQAMAVWLALSACWSAEVFIPDISYRFWRLTLQILSRYRGWLTECLGDIRVTAHPTISENTGSPSRTASPVLSSDGLSTESIAEDDQRLKVFAATIVDIQALSSNILALWKEEINMMLPEVEESGNPNPSTEALPHSLTNLTSIIPQLSSEITAILSRRCCEALLPMRSIPSQFRAMSNKRPPSEASHFVASILRPLKYFFGIGTGDAPGAALKGEFLRSYVEDVFESVTERYIYYLSAMKKTEESLRRLKKGKKSGFSLFGSGPTKEDDGDEERIRIQMSLDVEAFGREAESLGVNLAAHESYGMLLEMARSQEPVEAVS